jgi:GTP diphosphokinase / guanosine-3',5'-bis(diphosphate) 3'-diphosphatase
MRMDTKCLMAALLHDVIEDTPHRQGAARERFDEEIAELVDGVSKLTQIEFKSRAEAQAASLRKMLLAMSGTSGSSSSSWPTGCTTCAR